MLNPGCSYLERLHACRSVEPSGSESWSRTWVRPCSAVVLGVIVETLAVSDAALARHPPDVVLGQEKNVPLVAGLGVKVWGQRVADNLTLTL